MSNLATIKQEGAFRIQYTPGSAVTAGDVIVVGDLVGIATQDIAANELGSLVIDGVISVVKPNDEAWTVGLKVYYKSSTKVFTTVASGNTFAGLTGKAAAETATSGEVILKGSMLPDIALEAAVVAAQGALTASAPAACAAQTQDDLTDSSGGTPGTTLAKVTAANAITDNSGGVDPANDTIAAVTNITSLTDNGGGTADGTVASQAAPTTLTDNSGLSGSHDDTIAAGGTVANGTIGGSADGTLETVGATNSGDVSGAIMNNFKDVQGALAVLAQNQSDEAQKIIELVTLAETAQNNLKEVTTELATQRTANTAMLAAIAQLAAKQNTTSTAIGVIVNAVASLAAQMAKVKTDNAAEKTAIDANNEQIDALIVDVGAGRTAVNATLTSLKNASLMASA